MLFHNVMLLQWLASEATIITVRSSSLTIDIQQFLVVE